MKSATWLAAAGTAVLMSGLALAQPTILIDPTTNNGSFEFADGITNLDKLAEWDGVPNIDSWTEWVGESTATGDSGVESTGNATDGDMVAFMQAGNAIYNLTSYLPQAGDLFTFSWDHALRPDRDHSVWLVYDDGGVITKIDDSLTMSDAGNPSPFTYENFFSVPAGHPSIGNPIGIGVSAIGAYPEIDNFILDVESGGLPPVIGDVDGDRDVDLADYDVIRDNFRLTPATLAQGNLTGANIVDLEDFLLWRANFPSPSNSQAVPEPSTAMLMLLGLGGMWRRR